MKFITEMDLRDLYRTEPFATYVLQPDTKITPGARQFLVDRRVTLEQAQCRDSEIPKTHKSSQVQTQESCFSLRLRRRMDCIESLFLLIAAELLHSGDAVLSEEVMALGKYFRNVQKAERDQMAPDRLQFQGWSEEEIKKRSDSLKKYVDVDEFHVGLENGKVVAQLNYLRSSLREVEPALLETYWNEEKQVCLRQDLIDAVNLMINLLSMMMGKCLEGHEWKP